MIIAYCQAGGWTSRLSTVLSGHTSLAFTSISENGQRGVWISYVAKGTAAPGYPRYVMGRFSRGYFGKASYRVQLPSTEDGTGSNLSETNAYNWFTAQQRNFKDCVDCTNQLLKEAGAFAYYNKWILPTTPGQFIGWAGDVQTSMLNSNGLASWPAEPTNGRLFRDDNLTGKTVIPWGYGGFSGTFGNNRKKRQGLAPSGMGRARPSIPLPKLT